MYGQSGLATKQFSAALEFFRESLGSEDENIMCLAIEGISKCMIWDRIQDDEVTFNFSYHSCCWL